MHLPVWNQVALARLMCLGVPFLLLVNLVACDYYYIFDLFYMICLCNVYLSHDLEICALYKVMIIKSSIHVNDMFWCGKWKNRRRNKLNIESFSRPLAGKISGCMCISRSWGGQHSQYCLLLLCRLKEWEQVSFHIGVHCLLWEE